MGPAGTHLNICALLSQMGKHQEALQHAHLAAQMLEAAPSQEHASNSESLICVAYFNMGAEYEHLRNTIEAQRAYERAHESCLSELGEAHPLSQQIVTTLAQVKAKNEKKKTVR